MSRQDIEAFVGAVLLALGVYAISVGNGFVYDDVHMIVNNTRLHSLGNLGSILAGTWWSGELYRPVMQLSIALDWTISNGSATYFHIINVLLHGLATGFVFVFARGLLSRFGALVASFVFAVHPVHVEAVANVVGRAEVLAALFVVAAALVYKRDGDLALQHSASRRWSTSFGVLMLLVLAFGSKETALAAPGILLIVDWVHARRSGMSLVTRVRAHLVLLLASFALAVEWMLLRSMVLGELAGVHAGPRIMSYGLVDRTTIMAPVVVEWLRLLVFPLHLSADYSPDFLSGVPVTSLKALFGAAIVVGLVAVGVRARKKMPEITFAFMWLGGTLLIVSNVLVPSALLLAERSLYLPSVGFVLLLGWIAEGSAARNRLAGTVVVVLVLVAGMGRTLHRIPVWKSASVFFPQLVRDAPGSFRGMWVAGALAFEAGDRISGEHLMRQAIATYPFFSNTWSDLAFRFEEDERWLEAGQFYSAAYRIDSTRVDDAVSSVSNFNRAGELDSAQALAASAFRLHRDDHRLIVLQADIAEARGDFMGAMTWRRQLTWRFPDVWQYWYLTAHAAASAGYCPEVRRSLDRTLALVPDFDDPLDVAARLEEMPCE